MDGHEFFSKVETHPQLTWLGSDKGDTPEEDAVTIQNDEKGARFSVSISAILKHEWDELEAVLLGKRQSKIMMHLSRIVGYYSQLRNWNASKIAELNDRHRGDYTLPEDPPTAFEPVTPSPSSPRLQVAVASD